MTERPTGFVRTMLRPATLVRITEPGLKPSNAPYGAGAIGLPLSLRGISAARRARRRPVSLVLSARVNASFGKGRRQAALSSGSHLVAACAPTGASAGSAASITVRTIRFTAPNLHGIPSPVLGLLRADVRVRAGRRGAPRAVPPGAPRALPRVACRRVDRHGWRGRRSAARRADRVRGRLS